MKGLKIYFFTAIVIIIIIQALLLIVNVCYLNKGRRLYNVSKQISRQHTKLIDETIHFHLKKVEDLNMFVYSAVASSNGKGGMDINVIVMSAQTVWSSFKCCFDLDNGSVHATTASLRFHFPLGEMKSSVYTCTIPGTATPSNLKITSNQNCSLSGVHVPVDDAEAPKGHMSVCVHAVYGYINPEILIEWIEILWLQGIRRIYVYPVIKPSLVDTRSLRVFKYYQKQGLVKLIPYELAAHEKHSQRFRQRNGQMYSDEILPIYDCLIRSSYYKYTCVIDFDELIVPQHQPLRLLPLLDELLKNNSNAASFSFKIENFVYNWTKHNNSKFTFLQYKTRTQPFTDRSKTIYINCRYKAVYMHNMEPKRGYIKVNVPQSIAAIHHYTYCRPHWTTAECFKQFQRYKDTGLLDIRDLLQEKLLSLPMSIYNNSSLDDKD